VCALPVLFCKSARHNTLQDTARHCNTLQRTATETTASPPVYCPVSFAKALHKTHCKTLQHTATHCNTLQRAAKEPTAHQCLARYGVAWISWLLKIIDLFCKRALYERRYSAKETYNFKEPINRSHPIGLFCQSASMSIHNTV